MLKVLSLSWGSVVFAFNALRENLLRTTLSLLGVTVGIFSIISVLTLVDSLNVGIRNSLSFLGSQVIYVAKIPWVFGDSEFPIWKYLARPNPTYNEFKFLEKKLTWAAGVSVFAIRGNLTVRYKNSSVSPVYMQGISYEHNKIADIRIEEGRYFSMQENEGGYNVVLLGASITEDLFGEQNPIGKNVKIKGATFRVIGTLKKQGSNLIDTPSTDNICIVPFKAMAKLFSSNRQRGITPQIAVKGLETDTDLLELENEMRGYLRAYRGLKPIEEDNFALNQPAALSSFLDGLIGVLTLAGWFIGSFAMLVGGFSIANIMFVSVKERTNIIGIQKALGATNYFIMLQFLFESIFLSAIGGGAGLLLVSALSLLSTDTFIISLTVKNIILGVSISSFLGILAGIIPAYNASRLDPVIAIRTK